MGHSKNSGRRKFHAWATKKLRNITFLLAEDASKDLLQHANPGFINLSEFENLVADIADCIILFPETKGAIAELGLFSGSKKASRKLLIVTDKKHQSKDSFINLGHMATIDKA